MTAKKDYKDAYNIYHILRWLVKYGITALTILCTLHSGLLAMGYDLLGVHIMLCVFLFVLGIALSRFFQTQGNFQTMQMVVDITIEENGASKTYTTPDSLSVTYTGNELVIATERESILREIENIKAYNEEELYKVVTRRAAVAKCEKILAECPPCLRRNEKTKSDLLNLKPQ